MRSPARSHFERMTAAQGAASAGPGETLVHATGYELMLAKLATDKRRLKQIQSIQQKIAVKAEVLPEYADYVTGALEGGRGAQDDVLVTVMLWRLDAGDYDGALDIAHYASRHGLTPPDQFERSLSAVLAETFADAALDPAQDKPVTASQLQTVVALTEGADMHDQIRAKLYKALGLASQAQPSTALEHLRRALALNERVGVKKDIDRLNKQIEAASPMQDDSASSP